MPALEDMTRSLRMIVVDVQDAFLNTIPNADQLVSRISFAMEVCRLFKIGISVTEQISEKLKGTTAALGEFYSPEQCFPKTAFSAFQAPGLLEQIRKTDVHHILIAGLETPICIYQTVLEAMAQDMEVTLLSDCIGCRREEDVVPVLKTLQDAGCHVLPSETIFFSLLGDSTNPYFKPFSHLVKKYG
jgi:nicotinamidase-related amidase